MANNLTKTDEEILKLLTASDPQSISLLIKSHYRAIFDRLKSLTGNIQDSEDISQEVFSTIWEKRSELKLVPPIRGYLITIAQNKAINFLKVKHREGRHVIDISSDTLAGIISPPDSSVQKQMEKELRAAIKRIPRQSRLTYQLSRNFGMSNAEIAQKLNLNEKTVEKHMTIALRVMRKWIALLKLP